MDTKIIAQTLKQKSNHYIQNADSFELVALLNEAENFLNVLSSYMGLNRGLDTTVKTCQKLLLETLQARIAKEKENFRQNGIVKSTNDAITKYIVFVQKYIKEGTYLKIKEKNLYTQIALTYRLSLFSTAKLIGMAENQVYEELMHGQANEALAYLWNVETTNDTLEKQNQNYRKANNFLVLLMLARKKKDKTAQRSLIDTLLKEEYAYRLVKNKCFKKCELTLEDIMCISRYRVKYAITAHKLEGELGISRDWILDLEEKITDIELTQQLNDLNEYYVTFMECKTKPRE